MTTAGARSLSLDSQAVCAATAAAQTAGLNVRDVANQGLNGISGSSTRLLSSALTWATSPAQSRSSPAGSSWSWQTVTFICMANLPRAARASQVTTDRLSAIGDAEDVAVRILEPSDLHIAGNVHVAFALGVREIVV